MGNNILPITNTQCLGNNMDSTDDINDISKELHYQKRYTKRERSPTPTTSYEDNIPSYPPTLVMTKSLEYHNQKQIELDRENIKLKQEINDLKKQLQAIKATIITPDYASPQTPTTPILSKTPIGVLSSFLEYDSLLKIFLKFLRQNKYKQHIKLIEFYVYAQELKEYSQQHNAIKYTYEEKAQFIMNRFFNNESEHYLFQLNKLTIENVINMYNTTDNYGNFDPELFDETQSEIFEQISSEIFLLFVRSKKK
eukprot:237377_1